MKHWLIAPLLVIAAARAGDRGIDCSQAMTQYEMNACANGKFEAAQRRLEETYHHVMAMHEDRGARAKLVSAERAWMAFRDAECTFETADSEGGSIYPMLYSMCLAKLTAAHTQELERYLNCHRDAGMC